MTNTAQAFAAFPYTSPDKYPENRPGAPNGPLAAALGATVPFAIHDLVLMGGPSDADWSEARRFAQTLAERGDILQFGKKGEAAKLFAATARSIAVLAFLPGGVTTFGTHYEAYMREAVQP